MKIVPGKIILILCLIALNTGCMGSIQVAPGKPVVTDSERLVENNPPSRLNIPVQVSIEDLEKIVNQEKPSVVKQGWTSHEFTSLLTHEAFKYDIQMGEFALAERGNALSYSVSFSGSASVRGKIGELLTLPLQETIRFTGRGYGTIRIAVDGNWNLKPSITTHLELSKAEIKIAGFNLSVKTLLEDAFRIKAKTINSSVGKAMVDKLKLREKALKLWGKAHMVKKVEEAPVTWVRSTPLKISLKPIEIQNKAIYTGIGIVAQLDTVVAEKRPEVRHSRFPDLILDPHLGDYTKLILPVAVSVDELNNYIAQDFKGKRLHLTQRKYIDILKPALACSGNKIYVSVEFKGSEGFLTRSVTGTIYLVGNLVYDKKSEVLKTANLKFDIATRNHLLEAAEWIAKPVVVTKLQEKLMFNVSGELEKMTQKANKALGHLKLHDMVEAGVKIDKMVLDDVAVSGNMLDALFVVTGKIDPTLLTEGQ